MTAHAAVLSPRTFGGRALGWAMAALTLASCAGPESGVVARSDLGSVTREELEAHILSRPTEQQKPGRSESLATWRTRMVEGLLVDRALDAEVELASATPMPRGDSEAAEARQKVLLGAFEARWVDGRVSVDEAAVRAYYDGYPEEVGHEEQIRLRHIYRRVARDAPPEAWDAARSEMERLLERVRGGAHFGDLARLHSDSETAPLDGLIGRLTRGALDPEVESFVWNLEEGQVGDLFETPIGFHIFKLDRRLPAQQQTFDEVKGRLLRRLQKAERERLGREIFATLLAESGAEYHPERLQGARPPSPDTVLFSLGNRVITGAAVDAYRRTTPFASVRMTPPATWLEGQARALLFLWKAELEGLAEEPEVARALQVAERQARRQVVLERRMLDRLSILDADGELAGHYQEHMRRFQTPKRVKLRLLEIRFKEGESAYGVREHLERLAGQIRSGARDMAAVARTLSDDFSAPEGGDVGWVLLDGVGIWAGPAAQRAVSALAVGELSEPLLVERYDQSSLTYDRQGYVLVRKEGEEAPRALAFEEAWQQVADSYREAHRSELEAAIRRDILRSIGARVVEKNL